MEHWHWPTFAILAACAVIGFLSATSAPNLFAHASGEIVTFASLMAAGAMSAVVLVPTLMAHRFHDSSVRAAVKEFTEYHGALWMGVFGVASSLSVLILVGQIFRWTIPLDFRAGETLINFDIIRVLNGFVGFLLTYLIFRIFFLAAAIQDLLRSVFITTPENAAPEGSAVEEIDLPVDDDHGRVVEYRSGD